MPRLLQDKEIDMIRRFFDFDLTEKELTEFEQRMDTDQGFANEVEKYRLAYDTVDQLIITNRNGTENGHAKTDGNATGKAGNNFFRWLAMILIAVLVAGAYFFLNSGGESSAETEERVFAELDQYTRTMSEDVLRGEVTAEVPEADRVLGTIVQAFEADQDESVQQLQTYITNPSYAENSEIAEWCLANFFIKKGDTQQAKDILLSISTNNNYNSAIKAKEFLKDFK